jgi:hypothetical protein
VSVFGKFTGASTGQAQSYPLPRKIGETEVMVDGRAGPLFYASAGQINFQMPSATAAGQSVVEVRVGGTATRYRDLVAGKQEATLLRTPFELLAESRGYHRVATAEALGAYQGTVGLARRSWARAHEAVLVSFLRAYKAATDWLYEPQNREIAEALLVAHIRDMTPALAKRSYELLVSDKAGLSRDLAPSVAGIKTVLDLRSKFATPQKALSDPLKYVDLVYYNKAFGKQ